MRLFVELKRNRRTQVFYFVFAYFNMAYLYYHPTHYPPHGLQVAPGALYLRLTCLICSAMRAAKPCRLTGVRIARTEEFTSGSEVISAV